MYVLCAASFAATFLLKPAGHSNAKAFVKHVMHCRPINVTAERAPRRKRLYDSWRNEPPQYPLSRDARIDLCVYLSIRAHLYVDTLGRGWAFGQKSFSESDADDYSFDMRYDLGIRGIKITSDFIATPCVIHELRVCFYWQKNLQSNLQIITLAKYLSIIYKKRFKLQ